MEALLGRPPAGAFEVVVRHADGAPLVIANAPLLDDGTPMPTPVLAGRCRNGCPGRSARGGGRGEPPEAEVDAGELAAAPPALRRRA